MTNDRINEIATKYWDEEIDYDRGESYTSIDNIEDAIREALSSQWVDVKEGLPKEKVRYFVASKFWGFVEAELWAGSWFFGEEDRCIDDVTHYMEIPPKE